MWYKRGAQPSLFVTCLRYSLAAKVGYKKHLASKGSDRPIKHKDWYKKQATTLSKNRDKAFFKICIVRFRVLIITQTDAIVDANLDKMDRQEKQAME